MVHASTHPVAQKRGGGHTKWEREKKGERGVERVEKREEIAPPERPSLPSVYSTQKATIATIVGGTAATSRPRGLMAPSLKYCRRIE